MLPWHLAVAAQAANDAIGTHHDIAYAAATYGGAVARGAKVPPLAQMLHHGKRSAAPEPDWLASKRAIEGMVARAEAAKRRASKRKRGDR